MEATEPTKRCPRCTIHKPFAAFFTDNSRYDKLSPYCKYCVKERESRPERVAKRKAYKAGYHLLHAAEINAKSIQWGKDHPERRREKNQRSKKKRMAERVAAGEREAPRIYRNRLASLALGEKACSQCEIVKPLGDFYPWAYSPDGVQAECKDCHNGRSKPLYHRDTSIAEKECSQCGETKLTSEFYDNAYATSGIRAECRDCTMLNNAAWGRNNPEKRKPIANRSAQKARQDPAHGPIIRARAHIRRAMIKQAAIVDQDIDVAALYVRDRGVCSLCHKHVSHTLRWPDPMCATIDHIIPLTKGGEHSWKNVALAHFICNTRKNNRLALQQMRLF